MKYFNLFMMFCQAFLTIYFLTLVAQDPGDSLSWVGMLLNGGFFLLNVRVLSAQQERF